MNVQFDKVKALDNLKELSVVPGSVFSWFMVHDSWFMVHGEWLRADGV